jgi:hypothetical protein
MILGLREKLNGLRRLRIATVLVLSLVLLALPCNAFAEALGVHASHAVAAASAADSDHNRASRTHSAKNNENSTDCNAWLAARLDDKSAAIIAFKQRYLSGGDLFPVALAYAPLDIYKSAREYRFTGPPSVAFVDGTSLYATTRRYRI